MPLPLLQSADIFTAVLSKETWDGLSAEDKANLKVGKHFYKLVKTGR